MIISIIAVLLTFGMVIFLHELGHFLACRLAAMKIEAFSFGFGPELFGRTAGGTRYSVRAVPLGGYVKPAGENIEEATGAPDEYFSKTWYARLGVVLAGPAMNYILAFVLFFGVIYIAGAPAVSDEAVIGEMAAGYPAAEAGLKPGDKIVSVNGVHVPLWRDAAEIIHKNVEKKITIVFARNGKESSVSMTTRKDVSGKIGLVGISPEVVYRRVGFPAAVKMGAYQCYYWTAFTVSTLASNIYHRQKPDISGPIGIINIVSKAAHSGLADLVFLIGLISVAVGFFNLLPIPLLDGGHAVLYCFEGIFSRKITPTVFKYVNSAGLVMLAAILIFATYSDIVRLSKKPRTPVSLVGSPR